MAAPDLPADRAEGKTTAPTRPLIMRYAARSDVGRVRAKNDDSAYVGRHLAVVADGMGGHAGGDVASAATVLDMIHLDNDDYDGDAGTVLADEIQTANSLLSELVHINPKLAGMGTTVTALLLAEGKLHFAHIGDSRAYRLRNGEFEQVSVDHTFVQRLIDEGRLRPEEAETHPHKNVLMRVLGDVDASPELDLDTLHVEPGERWLLCSDGLNYVAGHVVERTVRETKDLGECADLLVELTLEAGAVHMLLGENGAGKSTLMKILSGAYTKDAGEIRVNGRAAEIRSPRDALALGIRVIYQELNLVPQLSVAENIFLGEAPVRWGGVVDWPLLYERTSRLLTDLGMPLDPRAIVSRLGLAQRQMVEIAKALSGSAVDEGNVSGASPSGAGCILAPKGGGGW